MKPFAYVITYAGVPTRAVAEEADAQAELARLNRTFRADKARRDIVPVFQARKPLGERQIRDLVARACKGTTVDALALVRAIEQEHGIQ